MKRKDIKADGTIYAVNGKPMRVVETERLWDYGHARFGRKTFVRPSVHGLISASDRPNGYTGSTHTGFLVVGGHGDAESMDDLTDLEIPVGEIGDAVWLDAWRKSLPDSLYVTVRVSRSFEGTWDDVQAAKQAERIREQSREEHEYRNRQTADAAYLKAESTVEAYGLWCGRHTPRLYGVYGPSETTPEAYVTLKASELTALLERLDPQTLLDAVADGLITEFAPIVSESSREASDMIEYVQRYADDVLNKK